MRRSKTRVYKWIATVLTAAMMAGQCEVSALAKEETVIVETGISDDNKAEEPGEADGEDLDGNGADDGGAPGDVGDMGDDGGQDADTEEEGDAGDPGNAGEGEEPSEGDAPEETVSENGLSEKIKASVTMRAVPYGIGDSFEGSDGFKYLVRADGEVGVAGHKDGKGITGDLTIPATVNGIDGSLYRVTSVFNDAFYEYTGISSVEIPESVTVIEQAAFWGCSSLGSITIPDSVSAIGGGAFYGCSSLSSITIPNQVKEIAQSTFADCIRLNSIEISDGVEHIGGQAFAGCTGLKNVKIPKSVTNIGEDAFYGCRGLESAEITGSVTDIGQSAFRKCQSLKSLHIVLDANETVTPPTVDTYTFEETSDDRSIVFLSENGAELAGDAFEKAKAAYLGDNSDGNTADDLWWGWKIQRAPAAADTYQVTVDVRKDDSDWPDSGRVFALTKDNGAAFVTDLSAVEAGTYRIYDVTGLTAGAPLTDGVDTGISVTAGTGETRAVVDYYTVTFYDGDTRYGEDTAQAPQIVLRGSNAAEPEEPAKAGWRFAGWKTQNGGSTDYDFSAAVNGMTGVYASWEAVSETETYTITATAGEGGSISPAGAVRVNKGETQAFQITAGTGYAIKSVLVDSADVTVSVIGANGVYTFTDVTADHRIEAAFEADGDNPGGGDEPGGDDNPGGGDEPGGDDNPGGGDEPGGDDNPGGGDEPGGDDNPGGGDEPGGDDNPGGGDEPGGDDKPDGDNKPGGDDKPDGGDKPGGGDDPKPGEGGSEGTENEQTVAVVKTAPPQTESAPASDGVDQGKEGTASSDSDKEPKTGDSAPTEIYATLAMIAGLTYLLLYFMEESRGMTEREKEVFVAAFIRWAKKGGRFRKCCALAAIFCLLVYYHGIGKHAHENMLRRACVSRV